MPQSSPPQRGVGRVAERRRSSPRRRRARCEQVLAGVPRSVLEHPTRATRRRGDRRSAARARLAAALLEHVGVEASSSAIASASSCALARLEPLGRERRRTRASRRRGGSTRAHSARPRCASTWTSTSRHQIQSTDASSSGIDSIDASTTSIVVGRARPPRSPRARARACSGTRIERDRAQAVLADEPDRMPRVARAGVERRAARPRAERRERVEAASRCRAARGSGRSASSQLRLVGPELVELLDRRHQPPAIAGSRMTVEPS